MECYKNKVIRRLMEIAIDNGEDELIAFERICNWVERMQILKEIGAIKHYGVRDNKPYKK